MLLASTRAQGLGEVWIDAHLHARRLAAIAEAETAHADSLGLGEVLATLRLFSEGIDDAIMSLAVQSSTPTDRSSMFKGPTEV